MSNKASKRKCKICSDKKLQSIHTSNQYEIIGCSNCGFGFLKNPPKPSELNDIYQEGYHGYISDEDFQADAGKKLRFVRPYLNKQSSLLDYGCGLGHFLNLSKPYCKRVKGFDVSQPAAKEAKRRYRLSVKSGNPKRSLFAQNSFDVITSFDVIEHILEFEKTLHNFHYWLKPGGQLFMTTPSLDSWDAELLGSGWYGFTRIPQHVIYFTRASMKLALEREKFRVERIKTWGFVRSLDYLLSQYKKLSLISAAIKKLGLAKAKVYLPMTDIMVVARA